MKIHRAITLVVMIVGSLLLIGLMTFEGIREWNSQSLVALLVVVVVAAVAGIAFSWRRYFPK
jgi:uncharacterized membrane-anchored protein